MGWKAWYYPYREIVPYDNWTNVTCFNHSSLVYFDTCEYHQALIEEGPCFDVYDSCFFGNVCGAVESIASLRSFEIQPNPANIYTTASLHVKQADKFTVAIYDMQGKKVSDEINLGLLSEGAHNIAMSLKGLSSGLYIVECRAASGSLYRKLIVE